MSFGGPAGQIAILHREVVERRRWLDEREFTRALNFCMLLPGPEALQLAIYLGWKLHGIRGGLVAGLGFILPAIVLLFALSYVYVAHGSLPWVAGLLYGLQAAVIALVLQAMVRIGRRALTTPPLVALAVGAFLALEFAHVPFPLVLLRGGMHRRLASRSAVPAPNAQAAPPRASGGQSLKVALRRPRAVARCRCVVVALTLGGHSLWSQVYLFFTKAALVTFGGAYAVLGYVTTHLVDKLGWLTADQSVAGLALAETTPGPLVIVLQFMGFMAGWNQPGAAVAARFGAAGRGARQLGHVPAVVPVHPARRAARRAPDAQRAHRSALGAITAAVVGVIATLALLLAQVVLFPDGWRRAPDWCALLIAVGAWLLLERMRWPLGSVLVARGAAGLLAQLPALSARVAR